MPSVTNAFARAMAEAAGMTLTDEGALVSNGTVVLRLPRPVDGLLADKDYFDLIDWIRERHPDEVALVEAYARSIQTDDLGVLGLAIKTAPTLRASLQRVERYFRLVTDTAVYQLVEKGPDAFWIFQSQTLHRAALELRNECALAGFAQNMHRFVGSGLVLSSVSFRHTCRCDPDRYAAHFGCPVQFDADQDAIQLKTEMLDLSNRLSDQAVSDFLTGHLETKMSSLKDSPSFSSTLLHHLTPTLSTGLPQAADIAREMGMSERTLYRRLAKEGLTFRDVLANAQSSLAQKLLRDDKISIAEIAFLTGFSEQSTFTRAFKRWVGKAPAQFRQQSSTV
ncbi:AraC family transcriptional regulator [Phaeobacter gallaeciensis]|uniref:AraC family transcriptional regulator n=2 Tax=Roseobacteraceae TaxID=2854170 RepID=A0A366WYP3_9RHOB|nr:MULTISPECIES: AraC family transcriptional regulator [Roseobacteraceae]MBT3143540.1 AraC family transcriptional regulator [Falsiruegeria litorea]MBT8167810.1 AraC family transcriptional regulator [Falsiruegeria litorea]RBW55515.1 AraC family transcriptional regulator [Phaeobacter gallaeciensis]